MGKLKTLFGCLVTIVIVVGLTIGGFYVAKYYINQNQNNDPQIGGDSHTKNLYTLSQRNGIYPLDSLGEQNILVIPVSFTDYEQNSTKTNKDRIEKAFFGESSETSYESVKSYYEKSSGNKLTINGKVTDWFDIGISSTELIQYTTTNPSYANSGEDGTWYVLDKAVEWYKENNDDTKDFDKDNNNLIDLVWLVYNVPNARNNPSVPSVYWAFSFYNMDNFEKAGRNNILGYNYCWSSFDFLYTGYGSTGIDAHTYIHETGHGLGLNDYYSTTSGADGKPSNYPFGGIDMMDFNVGDHCSYSKYLLGWLTPKDVISSAGTYTLKPTSETGEFYIISTQEIDSPFQEYFTIEFITPTGLNYKHYNTPYKGNGAKGYSKPGVKISHVDARAIKYSNGNYSNPILTENFNDAVIKTINNSTKESIYKSETGRYFKEITLMQKDYSFAATSVLGSGYQVNQADPLFYEGESFSLKSNSKYTNLMPSLSNKMNNGTTFDFEIKITSITNEKVTFEVI